MGRGTLLEIGSFFLRVTLSLSMVFFDELLAVVFFLFLYKPQIINQVPDLRFSTSHIPSNMADFFFQSAFIFKASLSDNDLLINHLFYIFLLIFVFFLVLQITSQQSLVIILFCSQSFFYDNKYIFKNSFIQSLVKAVQAFFI